MAEDSRPDAGKTPHIPKPPSPKEVEEISKAQALITDEWTGEGGTPASGSKPGPDPDRP